MDSGSRSRSGFVLMLCLLGAARCSDNVRSSCSCPTIPLRDLTKDPEMKCYNIGNVYRYQCIDGYVRKAGQSNLIRCRNYENGTVYWSKNDMEHTCIPDPRRKLTLPSKSTVTTASTSVDMINGTSISTPQATESSSTEQNSPGFSQISEKVTKSHTTRKRDYTTSATTDPLSSTVNHRAGVEDKPTPGTITALKASSASLVIICSLLGISYCLYRKRKIKYSPQPTQDEELPMNCASP